MSKETAVFAGGCFWCMVEPFEAMPGIEKVTSGYTGGHKENPTYEEVCSGTTGHTEAVEVVFDNETISYSELLDIYWQQTDPTDAMGQFVDRGDSYRPEIFVNSQEQAEAAQASKEALDASGRFSKPVLTKITEASTFWPAEDYHQQFYQKNPAHYKRYAELSGRKTFIKDAWEEV
ncbi:peptide-methionine (S)-S-oxide reductase MsrA [Aerococcus sp. 1KP-2016]|jgi:peptide-methionine (S)-S-oxide reductase|uniref:peptide-methionine (S)-S-oxide reductase MsrA n=1 Tax=Aerococcus sp. 1KP-2016 TaxID=1981982 RepID=UPI000B984680|nr:peptide-methionine (S)-S-oxide reductase MsrA [Aerococcus sp. 1KP-2016]OYQ65038.1 peptide-methionine (S)-S-oxide reductase [Aerococcus sp. 1KP-2016]